MFCLLLSVVSCDSIDSLYLFMHILFIKYRWNLFLIKRNIIYSYIHVENRSILLNISHSSTLYILCTSTCNFRKREFTRKRTLRMSSPVCRKNNDVLSQFRSFIHLFLSSLMLRKVLCIDYMWWIDTKKTKEKGKEELPIDFKRERRHGDKKILNQFY